MAGTQKQPRPIVPARIGTQEQPRPTVLVVEDDDQMRAMLEVMLSRMGCKSLAVSRATEALRPIESGQANLVLLDLQMPGVTGIDLLRTLRRRNLTIPIVVVSAFISAQAAQSCAELGVQGMVAKPFDQARLVSEIHRLLRQAGFEFSGGRCSSTATASTCGSARAHGSARALWLWLTGIQFCASALTSWAASPLPYSLTSARRPSRWVCGPKPICRGAWLRRL